MGVGELLDEVRQCYLDRLIKAAKGKASRKTKVIREAPLRDRDGELVTDGIFDLPLRKDLVVLEGDEVTEMLTVDTEGMLSFEPITFDWSETLRVTLKPFQWQRVSVRMPTRKEADWRPLVAWFWRWFHAEEDGGEHDFLGAIHFLSDPEASGRSTAFEADLGSAPVEAFEELLDAVAEIGFNRCEIGTAV